MKNIITKLVLSSLIFAAPLVVQAQEKPIQLIQAEGFQYVQMRCIVCHSLDYIVMNSKFMDKKGWEATVNKMIGKYGAPVQQEEVQGIVDYLTKNYGK